MKLTSKIGCLLSIGLLCSTMIPGTEYCVHAAEKTWQEAYLAVIENYSPDSHPNASFQMYYVDGDAIPELYVDAGEFVEGLLLYTYYENEAVLCKEDSYRGSTYFYSSKNGIFREYYAVNAGAEAHEQLLKLENGTISMLYNFCHDTRELHDETLDDYYINDEKVTKEAYESKITEVESEYSLSLDFQVTATQYTYDEMKQYLLDTMESEENGTTTSLVSTETTTTQSTTTTVSESSTQVNTTQTNTTTVSTATTTTHTTSAESTSPNTGEHGIAALSLAGMAALLGSLLCRKRK